MRGFLAQAAAKRLQGVIVKALPTMQESLALLTREIVDTTQALRTIEQHLRSFREHTIQGLVPLAQYRALLPQLRLAKQSCAAYGVALDAVIEALEQP